MKLKRMLLSMTAVAAMGLVLGPGAAQAAPVVERDGDTATAIRDLDVGGVLYDVVFVDQSSATIYGDPPTFDFTTLGDAGAAVDAANAALNEETGITDVGESSANNAPIFRVGFGVTGDGATRATQIWGSTPGDGADDVWVRALEPDFYPFLQAASFADFTP